MYVNHIITASPEGATATVDMLMIGLNGDPYKIRHEGYYEDTYVRTPQGWRFKSRIHHVPMTTPPAEAGQSDRQKYSARRGRLQAAGASILRFRHLDAVVLADVLANFLLLVPGLLAHGVAPREPLPRRVKRRLRSLVRVDGE